MKKLMITAAALTAAFAPSAETYTPSTIPTSLTESDVTPGEINYQGLLRDPAKGNLYSDGIYTLECRLYTQESGGTPIWGASYNAYVKGGYFNLMLGSTGAELAGCTYGPTALWKALWYKTGTRDLYLGVTPRQGADGAALVSPTEIKPRQKLLTAPYAFRAQKAQYADAAPGNFKVAGNLDVAGNVTVANGKSLTLKNITASDSEVKLGNSKSSPAKTTLQGSTVLVEAGSALNVNSHGNATVTMDSGRALKIQGGTTTIDSGAVTVKSSSSMTIDGGSVLAVAGDEVRGKGALKWNIYGRNDPYVNHYTSPIFIRGITFTMAKNSVLANVDLRQALSWSSELFGKYTWGVIGVRGNYPAVIADVEGYMLQYLIRPAENSTTEHEVTVTIIGIAKEWVSNQ